MTQENMMRFAKNLLYFTAPAFGIFFYQLSTGVSYKEAGLIAIFALYAALADFFKKYGETK